MLQVFMEVYSFLIMFWDGGSREKTNGDFLPGDDIIGTPDPVL